MIVCHHGRDLGEIQSLILFHEKDSLGIPVFDLRPVII